MLTDQERLLARQAWSAGPGPLMESGLSLDAIRVFLDRVDVKAEFALLDAEFRYNKTLDARIKFVARRNLSRLHDGAAATLARALRGRVYARHEETGAILTDAAGHPIIEEMEPGVSQIRAAGVVLDAVGVTNPKIVVDRSAADVQPALLLESAEHTFEIETDPTFVDEEQRSLSRERMRTAIDMMLKKLPDIRQRVRTGLGLAEPAESNGSSPTRKKKRKVAKKGSKRGKKT